MANFEGVTACNGAKIPANKRVPLKIFLEKYRYGELSVGIDNEGFFIFNGYEWPCIYSGLRDEDSVMTSDIDPYEDMSDEFYDGLREFMPNNQKNPLIIHAIGYEKCRYPLSAMEIIITKKKVRYYGFKG